MKTLYRYYLKEFIRIWSVLAPGLAFVFSLLEIIDKIDDFAPGKLTVPGVLEYAFLIFPKFLYYILPMSLLICGLFVFSQAARSRETVAFKATGGRMRKLFYPFIAGGVLFSLAGFLLGEVIIPDFSERLLEFKKGFMKKIGKVTVKENTIWMRSSDGSLVRIELYVPDRKLAKGISIFEIEGAQLKKRIEAEEALWESKEKGNGLWKLYKVLSYDIQTGSVKKASQMNYPFLESPDLFVKVIRSPEEMGISDLKNYISRMNAAGIRDPKLVVDLYGKLSYPFANLIMLVLGISLSVMGRAGGGLFAAGLGIFISFIYWFSHTFMLSMGYAQILPPAIATCMIPFMFGAVSLSLFVNVPE